VREPAGGAVLDASAILALLLGEPGAERVEAALEGGAAPTTILAEVVGYFARHRLDVGELKAGLGELEVRFVPLDDELAWRTGELEPPTRAAGLSLTDRSCLALAERLGTPALTGDRQWTRVAGELGIEVELIR
jgi:ribonuclease VapC